MSCDYDQEVQKTTRILQSSSDIDIEIVAENEHQAYAIDQNKKIKQNLLRNQLFKHNSNKKIANGFQRLDQHLLNLIDTSQITEDTDSSGPNFVGSHLAQVLLKSMTGKRFRKKACLNAEDPEHFESSPGNFDEQANEEEVSDVVTVIGVQNLPQSFDEDFFPQPSLSMESVNVNAETNEDNTNLVEEENSDAASETLSDETNQLEQLCRLCALPKDDMVYIFDEAGVQIGLRSKINTWLPTHVSRTDPLPKQVCDGCIRNLDFCNNFAISCLKAQQVLNNLLVKRQFRCRTIPTDAGSNTFQESDDENLEQSSDVSVNKTRSDKDLKSASLSPEGLQFPGNISTPQIDEDSLDEEQSAHMIDKDTLLSDESSENELINMILGKDFENGNDFMEITNYCCPLCIEGNMFMVKQIDTTSLNTSDTKQTEEPSHVFEISKNESFKNKKSVSIEISPGFVGCRNVKELMPSGDNVSEKHNVAVQDEGDLSFEDDPAALSDSETDNYSETDSFIFDATNVRDEEINTVACEDVKKNRTKISETVSNMIISEDVPQVNCVLCSEAFKNLNECLLHALQVHAKEVPNSYPCTQCDKRFTVDTDLNRHFMLVHQKMKSARLLHICVACGRRCASQRALASHICIPVQSVQDQLACHVCGKSFSTKKRLEFHHYFHLPGSSLECVPCEKTFEEEDNLYDHVRFSHRGQTFHCTECGRIFSSKSAVKAHKRIHQNLREHTCEVCNKSFLDKQTLKEHCVSHMEVKPYQCHICGKYMSRNSRLKRHLMSHEMQKAVKPQQLPQCQACGETFPNESLGLVHFLEIHESPAEECMLQHVSVDKVYRCEYCDRCFADGTYLNNHRKIHSDESLPFKCHICKAGFTTFARVATHKMSHRIYEKKSEFSVPKLFQCDECNKSYLHWTYLSVHRKMIHAEEKYMYKCKQCPEEFVNSWSLASHRKRHCREHDLSLNERKPWKCDECEKRYVSEQALLSHISTQHTAGNPGPNFQCDKCGKCFASKQSLSTHKEIHDGTKIHECHICEKKFYQKSSYVSHLRHHQNDKSNICEYCGITFRRRGDRDDHIRKHTGERPFKCRYCPKSFRTRAMWNEHSRIHRDERPFPCDICGAAFRRSFALKNHKIIHTGERPHSCNVCGKAFRQKSNMLKHMKTHNAEKLQEQIDEALEVKPSVL